MIDIHTGKIIWKAPGHEWVGYREQYYNDDWYYIIAEGIHALDLEEGKKWEYLISNSYTNVAKEVAIQSGLFCLSLLGGGTIYRSYQPDITMNMNSAPLFDDGDLYFAARDKIICLDKLTGKLQWESLVDPELESMNLYNISDKEIVLVGMGKKILKYILEKSDPPTIRIIQKSDGKITGLFSLEDEAIVQDFDYTDENLFLLTPDKMFVFNRDLKILGVSESTKEYGNFLTFLSVEDNIILRTSNGLLGLLKDTFSEEWFRYCELPAFDVEEEWKRPIYEKNKIDNESIYKNGLYWTPNEANGITAYDVENWKEIKKISLFGKNVQIYNDKYYIDFEKNKIKFISFE